MGLEPQQEGRGSGRGSPVGLDGGRRDRLGRRYGRTPVHRAKQKRTLVGVPTPSLIRQIEVGGAASIEPGWIMRLVPAASVAEAPVCFVGTIRARLPRQLKMARLARTRLGADAPLAPFRVAGQRPRARAGGSVVLWSHGRPAVAAGLSGVADRGRGRCARSGDMGRDRAQE